MISKSWLLALLISFAEYMVGLLLNASCAWNSHFVHTLWDEAMLETKEVSWGISLVCTYTYVCLEIRYSSVIPLAGRTKRSRIESISPFGQKSISYLYPAVSDKALFCMHTAAGDFNLRRFQSSPRKILVRIRILIPSAISRVYMLEIPWGLCAKHRKVFRNDVFSDVCMWWCWAGYHESMKLLWWLWETRLFFVQISADNTGFVIKMIDSISMPVNCQIFR
jgi:hypothetical protein